MRIKKRPPSRCSIQGSAQNARAGRSHKRCAGVKSNRARGFACAESSGSGKLAVSTILRLPVRGYHQQPNLRRNCGWQRSLPHPDHIADRRRSRHARLHRRPPPPAKRPPQLTGAIRPSANSQVPRRQRRTGSGRTLFPTLQGHDGPWCSAEQCAVTA